ncbi:MAG: RHO alpha subunit C-terminal catalytic domain-containing protein, partial [Pseudomonadota bacterium]
PLHEVLGILPEHFERYDHAKRYKAVHVAKVVRANWKVVAEAFMESWHTVDTHPQIMPYLACVNSQYDVYSDYISRQISAQGIASPHIAGKITEQEIVDAMLPMSRVSSGIDSMTVPEGGSARKIVAQLRRENMSRDHGRDYSHAGEAEMMDAILYNVFPNFSVWGGFPTNLVYRWRPNGMDPNSAIMEAMYMAPIPEGQPRPDPAPCHWVSEEGGWKEAEELGGLADVFVQDEGNLPYVQEGLNASWNKKVIFSNYNEMRIRQMHITLDKYLNDEV